MALLTGRVEALATERAAAVNERDALSLKLNAKASECASLR